MSCRRRYELRETGGRHIGDNGFLHITILFTAVCLGLVSVLEPDTVTIPAKLIVEIN